MGFRHKMKIKSLVGSKKGVRVSVSNLSSILLKPKRSAIMHEILIHIVIVALIFGLFFVSSIGKTNSRAVKQQVIEKQLALMIDSGEPGISLYVNKLNMNGKIENVKVDAKRVYVYLDGRSYSVGYPYFSRYAVSVETKSSEFVIHIR